MSTRETLKGRMTKDSVSLLPCFYFVELPILVSSVVSLYFLELTDIFKPVRWGFSCHDRSLSLPYVDPTHEVVPFLMLLILAFAAPTITIMIGEGILFCCLSRKHSGPGAEVDINAAGCNFNSYIRRSVRFVGVHAFGLCATALITDVIQLATGYHAPYFLTVCKPNYTHLNTSCDKNTFIIEDICSGADSAILNAGRKSFPSQHATLASFAAVYISMYFNSTLTDSSKLLKPLLVFSFIICAIICGLTRIIQHKNHAVDVYLGFLLGGAVAVYLGLYAVGNFQASEEGLIREVWERCLPRPGPEMCQAGAAHHHPHPHHLHHHLPAKSCAATGEGLPPGHAPGILHRSLQPRDTGSLASVKRASADVETLGPHVSLGREGMVTFSHTLPRAHTPALDDAARRNATIHTSMDCSRSKQLLSQWKSKNESRKLSLQGNDPCVGQSPPGGMEMRSNSEPSTVGINGEHQGPMASQCYKLTTGSSTLPSNASGITAGARVSIQSRPGSSQLVHIPEEAQENAGTSSPHSASTCARDRWLKGMERSASVTATAPGCRTSGQPRIMQVIAMSKQQGLLPTGSQSFDSSELSCSGNIHYKAMMEQEAGAGQAGTGPIVRVEAHPEVGRPLAQPSPSNGSAPWMWRSQSSLRQSFELNDLNRDSESSDGGAQKDGFSSTERRRSNSSAPIPVTVPTVPTVSGVSTISNSTADHHLHQSISTIRVTPMEGGDPASECLSAAPSRDSTLRRKGNAVLIPERGNCLDNTRNVFYKGTPSTPTPKD